MNKRAISLGGDYGPRVRLGFLGELTERDGDRVRIFHGPWRPTEDAAIRAAERALERRGSFPLIP